MNEIVEAEDETVEVSQPVKDLFVEPEKENVVELVNDAESQIKEILTPVTQIVT